MGGGERVGWFRMNDEGDEALGAEDEKALVPKVIEH